MNKIVEALRGKYLTDLGCNALLNGDYIEVHLPQLEQIAAILQAPEPAGFQVRNSYSKNEWTGCHGFATTKEAEECNSEWRYTYTAPPALAEIERQLAEAQKDQARLDFVLENDAFRMRVFKGTFPVKWQLATQDEDEEYVILSGENETFDTLRQAIDAAMTVKP